MTLPRQVTLLFRLLASILLSDLETCNSQCPWGHGWAKALRRLSMNSRKSDVPALHSSSKPLSAQTIKFAVCEKHCTSRCVEINAPLEHLRPQPAGHRLLLRLGCRNSSSHPQPWNRQVLRATIDAGECKTIVMYHIHGCQKQLDESALQ